MGDALHLGVQGEPGFVSYPWREDGVDPGGEAIVTSPATVVTVVASGALPVGGPIALMLLCSAMAVVGRRKK